MIPADNASAGRTKPGSDSGSDSTTASPDDVPLKLETFLPYLLSVASNTISGGIANLYAERFELSIPQWRIMAVVGRFDGLSARQVAERTAMDKVAVSRALKRLEDRGFLHRRMSSQDRRRSVLRLTGKGRDIYDQVAPIAIDYERRLLEVLSTAERAQIAEMLQRLMEQAREL